MNVVEITDPQASQLDVYARLTEAQLRSRRRPEDGLFIAELLPTNCSVLRTPTILTNHIHCIMMLSHFGYPI